MIHGEKAHCRSGAYRPGPDLGAVKPEDGFATTGGACSTKLVAQELLGEANGYAVNVYGVEGRIIIVTGDEADDASNKRGGALYWAEVELISPALGPFVVLVPVLLVLEHGSHILSGHQSGV